MLGIERVQRKTKCQYPENLREDPDIQELNYWISCCFFFFLLPKFETKTLPPRTILAGLQRYKLAKNPSAPKFLDKGETCFSKICGTCDIVYRELCSKGIGAQVCHTPVNYHTRRRG